jgi:biopolymer transport protein ExbB/TolQ
MTIRFAFLLILLALLGGFVALNWAAFIVPTTLFVGMGMVDAPLGLIMLGIVLMLLGLFVVYVLYLHAAELLRTRRLLKDMASQRKQLEQAESSRITELHSFIASQFAAQQQRDAQGVVASQAQTETRLQSERKWIEEIHNGLAAQIGQLEDRLDRLLPAPGPAHS